jgi:hypothetical protein
MKFREDRPLANVDAAVRKLLEITNAIEADHAGRVEVGTINRRFRDACGSYEEYSAAVKAATRLMGLSKLDYFSELLIAVYFVLRFVPRPLTTAMMASAIPAAIKPYSIAVAPDSSDKNFKRVRCNSASIGFARAGSGP